MYGCEELTDAFIEEVVEAHPTVLILAGDLTFNGAKISHEAFAQKIAPIEQAGIPIIAIPGNHDLTINRSAKFHGMMIFQRSGAKRTHLCLHIYSMLLTRWNR